MASKVYSGIRKKCIFESCCILTQMQKTKDSEKVRFCLLVFGNMGAPGIISFKSILEVNRARVCVLANISGRNWIESILESVDGKSRICFHEPDSDMKMKLLNSKSYSEFGSKNFAEITFLKWDLLLQTLNENDQNIIVFSDLDVYWKRDPSYELKSLLVGSKNAAIQQDFNKLGSKFCTGIMAWKNTILSKKLISEIRQFNLEILVKNPSLTDENALNSWYKRSKSKDYFIFLPTEKFIIGHRIIHLILGISGFNLKKFVAFHANYCIGEVNKSIMLDIASLEKTNILKVFTSFVAILKVKFF